MAKASVKNIFSTLFGFLTDKLYFCMIYFIATVIRSFPVLVAFVDPFMKVFFLWGIALLAWDFFTERTMFKGYKSALAVAFIVFNAVSVVTNTAVFYEGVKHLIYNAIFLLLFYPAGEGADISRHKRIMVRINDVYIAFAFAASVISIVMFLFRTSYTYSVGATEYYQGVWWNRLYGIYVSANPGALTSTLAVFLTPVTYALDKEHFRRWRVFYIINVCVQFVYYSLTLSNGGLLAWLFGIAAVSAVFVYPNFKKRFSTVVSLLLAALVLLGSAAALEGVTFVTRKAMVAAAVSINAGGGDENPDDPEKIVLERVEGDAELSNGRLTIWEAGITATLQKPVFGWADCEFYEDETKIIPFDDTKLTEIQISELKRCDGYMHNALVQVVTCGGIAGLLVLVVFAAAVIRKYIRALLKFSNTEYYIGIAATFVLLLVLASQVAAESHILYVRQDSFAGLFWLYLGFGIQLIRKSEKETADRFAFMCDTPLQVLNATAFVSTDKMGSKGKSDLFLYHQFRGSEELSARLKEQGVFENVYDFKKFRTLPGAANKLLTLWRILFPKSALKKIYMGKGKRFLKNRYSTLVVSFYTQFSDCLHNHFKDMRTVQIEDGLGSYVTADLENRYRTGLFSFVNKFLFSGSLSYDPQVLYLNNPQLGIKQVLPVEKLDSIATDKELLKTACRIFDYKENPLYSENRTVFLGQPLDDRPEIETIRLREAEINPVIAECEPVVRLHPRQTDGGFEDYKKDTEGNMWELECANSITDSHVLIGAFSTAQFTPKMMFGTEPTLIFLYKLLGCNFDNADQMTEQIRNAYTDKDKVIVVENMEQLKQVIDSVRKGE